jgi:hypothetical protein
MLQHLHDDGARNSNDGGIKIISFIPTGRITAEEPGAKPYNVLTCITDCGSFTS